MRSKLLVAIGAALLGLGAGWLLGRAPKPVDGEDRAKPDALAEANVPPMPPPRIPDVANLTPASVAIPLTSIYSVIPQNGLKSLNRDRDEEFARVCDQFDKRLETLAFRTAFLVQVPTIYGAVGDTLETLNGRGTEHHFLLSQEWGRESVWAVLFLGNLLDNHEIAVTSAVFAANELVVTYRDAQLPETTRRSFPHLYWVPLPPVQPGTLTLRLRDGDTKLDVLVVRTTIQEVVRR
jgi:hypothetical protein